MLVSTLITNATLSPPPSFFLFSRPIPGSQRALAAEEVSSRTIRIKGLPERTQEGLLEQELRKHFNVKHVDLVMDLGEAVVELVSPAVSS